MVKLVLMLFLNAWLGVVQLTEAGGVADVGANARAMVEFYLDATLAIHPNGASRVYGRLIKRFGF